MEIPDSATREKEGIVYGHIASVVPENCKNNYEFSFLLNSIADEFAYALYNLELASKQKKAEEELRLDELRIKTVSEFSRITDLSHREMAIYTLREAVRISKSSIGYIALIDDDNQSIVLMTLESDFFITEVKEKSYSIKDLSVITKIINRCRTQITEDEDKLGEIRNIYSADNFILNRHIDIPVSASGRVAAVVGLGNMEIP